MLAAIGAPREVMRDRSLDIRLDLREGLDRLTFHFARSLRINSACG